MEGILNAYFSKNIDDDVVQCPSETCFCIWIVYLASAYCKHAFLSFKRIQYKFSRYASFILGN